MMFAVLDAVGDAWRVCLLTPDAVFAPTPLRILDVSAITPALGLGWITEDDGRSFRDPAVPLLAEAQAMRIAALRTACASAIVAGFRSAALGAPHDYPADDASQRNLLSERGCPVMAMLMCADLNGSWTLLPHTAQQVEQVVADWNAHRQAQQQQLLALSALVRAAADVAAVQAIAWA